MARSVSMWEIQIDETGDDDEIRIVVANADGVVMGDIMFRIRERPVSGTTRPIVDVITRQFREHGDGVTPHFVHHEESRR